MIGANEINIFISVVSVSFIAVAVVLASQVTA